MSSRSSPLVTVLLVAAAATAVVGGLMAFGVLTFAGPGPTATPIAQPTGPASPPATAQPTADPSPSPEPTPTTAPTPTELPSPEPQQTPGGTYVVQPGDTLEGIGVRFGVPWTLIAQANELEEPYIIFPNQVLVIPVDTAPGEEDAFYVVQPGDTLDEIAYQLDVATALLAEANDIENWNEIYAGQRLIIPGREPAESSPSPSPGA